MEKDVKTQWHPAFCSAIKLELREDAESLTYTDEYIINSMPIKMDMLIIKKEKYVEIKNQIGKIFREHNVIEYKSADDSMSVDAFIKTKGYACIYKANEKHVDDILLDEITITLIREKYPRKLLHWFQDTGYTVTEKYPGIYYVLKVHEFPIQVIVSGMLSEEHQQWLTLLKSGLSVEEMKRAVRQTNDLKQKNEKDQADAVMQVVFKENSQVFALVKEDAVMCEALRELMAKEIQEEVQRVASEAREEGKLEKLFQLVKKNIISAEVAANETEISVKEFMERMRNFESA